MCAMALRSFGVRWKCDIGFQDDDGIDHDPENGRLLWEKYCGIFFCKDLRVNFSGLLAQQLPVRFEKSEFYDRCFLSVLESLDL